MKYLKTFAVVACAVIVAAATLMPVFNVSAEGSSSALSINPRKNYVIEPGESVKDTLVITNKDTVAPLHLSLNVVDFTSMNDTGAPKLNLAADAPQETWSLKPYLTVPETVTIEPGSTKVVNIGVDLPSNIGGGSLYSAIVYSSGDPTDGGNVGLSASGVTLVFADIPGDVTQNLVLKKMGLYGKNKNGEGGYQRVTTETPMVMAFTLKNDGNVTEAALGSMTIRDIFGNERMIGNVNPNKSLALIGQERTFTTCIKTQAQNLNFEGTREEASTCANPGLWPGYYNVSLDLLYGQNGNATKDITGSASFWYLPWWFIMVVTAVIAIVGYFVWRIVRFFQDKFGRSVKLKK